MKSTEDIDQETWNLIVKISKNIRGHRKQRGLKQADMGTYGFGARWYQRLESGRHVPTIPTLHRLAQAFNIDISELFK